MAMPVSQCSTAFVSSAKSYMTSVILLFDVWVCLFCSGHLSSRTRGHRVSVNVLVPIVAVII